MPNKDSLLFAIADMSFLSLREKLILKEKLDNISELALLSKEELSVYVGRPVRSRTWNGQDAAKKAEYAALLAERCNIAAVLFGSSEYPPLLAEIYDPPFMLFVRGNASVLAERCLSVVGTRNPSHGGGRASFVFSAAAADDGYVIVSGLAYGIDAAAHSGAVSVHGKSIAVLACGVDTVQPLANKGLAQKILSAGGCLISEYVPATGAQKWRFLQRNRIIAGLSGAVVVIEAPPGSGALITADFALEQDRELLFHSAAFSQEARMRAAGIEKKITKKTPRRCEQYAADGACIIDTYEDYCRRTDKFRTGGQLQL